MCTLWKGKIFGGLEKERSELTKTVAASNFCSKIAIHSYTSQLLKALISDPNVSGRVEYN